MHFKSNLCLLNWCVKDNALEKKFKILRGGEHVVHVFNIKKISTLLLTN